MEIQSPLVKSLFEKTEEQIERIAHLVSLAPRGKLDWYPAGSLYTDARPMSLGGLLGHLLDCLAGFCAILHSINPEPLAHFVRLRELPVNCSCSPDEALARIAEYRRHIGEGFRLLADDDLREVLPTVFVSQGETALTILLGNLEHLINHKFQLFFYLKLMGISVSTPDLYRFRG